MGEDSIPPEFEFEGRFDADLDEAVSYLVRRSVSLAEEFAAAFEVTVQQVLRFPLSGATKGGEERWTRVDDSPYSIVYVTDAEGAFVHFVALVHASRRPGYWRDRL